MKRWAPGSSGHDIGHAIDGVVGDDLLCTGRPATTTIARSSRNNATFDREKFGMANR